MFGSALSSASYCWAAAAKFCSKTYWSISAWRNDAIARGDDETFLEPAAGFGRAALRCKVLGEPGDGVHVGRVFLQPLLVILGEAGEVVAAEEHILDAPPNIAVQPAIGVQFGEQFLEVGQRLGTLFELDLQLGNVHAEGGLAVLVIGRDREFLQPRQRLIELPFLDERGGDLFLHAGVVRVELFQPVPDVERFVRPLGTLVDAAEGLEDVEQVVAVRLAGDGPLERLGGGVRLADQDE